MGSARDEFEKAKPAVEVLGELTSGHLISRIAGVWAWNGAQRSESG